MPYLTEGRISYLEALRKREGLPKGLIDSYAWHIAAWQAFPGKPNDARDFLTRVDRTGDGYRLILLSQTAPTVPDWWEAKSWGTKEISPAYFGHSRYMFQLRANATKTFSATGLRSGISCPLELTEWLDRKGANGGFIVEQGTLQVIPGGMDSFVRQGKRGFHSIADFKGILKVTNKELFYQSVMQGVGRAKGFGCGMLMVVPLITQNSSK